MPPVAPSEPSEPNRFVDVALLRCRDQRVVVGVLLLGLVILGAFRLGDYFTGRTIVEYDELSRREIRFVVDLNRADATELAKLPVIGPAIARRIVEYRDHYGAFRTIDELGDVTGIGPKTLEAIRPHVLITAE
jgi:competence protein ComEA